MTQKLRILVPIPPEGLLDDVRNALEALGPAHLELLAVVPAQTRVNPHTTLPDDAFEEARWGEDRRQSEQVLEQISLSASAVSRLVERGDPAEQIVARARDGEFDFIVMATRGNAGLKRMVLGSVTDEVVRTAPCPVVVVPPRSAAA